MASHTINETLAIHSANPENSRRIAWSRQGLIAYGVDTNRNQTIAENLLLSHMECVDGKNWQLACPTRFRLNNTLESSCVGFKSNKRQPTITLLEFSTTGWDLFVADENGIISILVTGLKRVQYDQQDQPPPINPTEFTRTSFNTCVMFYSDYNASPQPDISTPQLTRANQVIAIKWLNSDKVTAFNLPAVRMQQSNQNPILNGAAAKHGAAFEDANGSFFQYGVQQNKVHGAVHPIPSKQVCIAVRRSGEVCLIYQEDHGIEYKKVVAGLGSKVCEVNKASIGFTRDGKVIIVAHFANTDQLRFYQLDIDWGFLKLATKLIAEQPHYRVPDDQRIPPKITIKKLFIETMDNKSQGMRFSDIYTLSPSNIASTNFEILVKTEKLRKFTHDEIKTEFTRYNLDEVRISQSIPKSFKNMTSKKGIDITTISGSKLELNYKQTFTINEVVCSLQTFSLDMHIGLILANGCIKLLDRNTFSIIKNLYHENYINNDLDSFIPNSVQTFYDAGFEFPIIKQQFDVCCISPNMCGYVFLPTNSLRLNLNCVNRDNVHSVFYKGSKKGLMITTAAAIALRHTTACYQGFFTDDIICTLRNEIQKLAVKTNQNTAYQLTISVLQECHRAINLNIDIPTDQSETMSRSQPLQRLLSLQLSLGTMEAWQKTKSGKIGFALINLRFVITAVVYVINTVYQNIQRFSKKGIPDIVENLVLREKCILSSVGLIRWCLDYIIMLSQELFELQNAFKLNNTEQIEELMKNSIAVPMIIGKVPRGFLLTAISSLKRLFSFLQKLLEKTDPHLIVQSSPDNPLSVFQKLEEMFLENDASVLLKTQNAKFSRSYFTQPTLEAYLRIGSMLKNLPVSLIAFEKFLTETDAPLRNIKLDPGTSLAMEQQIVCQGLVKLSFREPMKKVCEVFNKLVLQYPDTSMSKLYFYDVSWIGISTIISEGDSCINAADKNHFYGLDGSPSELPKNSDESDGAIIPVTSIKRAKKQFSLAIYQNLHDGLLLDSLRKTLSSPEHYLEDSGSERIDSSSGFDENKSFKIRKCIRCGAISAIEDDVVVVTSHFSFINSPVFQHYQRQCLCGGSWANI